jgi:GcrA cell cycle regulator
MISQNRSNGKFKETWNEADTELLRKLWAEGFSCSQIGNKLGRTKNAVIGRVHRLGLPQRLTHTTIKRKKICPGGFPPARRKARREPHAPTQLPAPLPPQRPPADWLELVELKRNHCRWPAGDTRAGGVKYCGQPRDGTRPYCEHHARGAYEVSRARSGGFRLPPLQGRRQ